MRVLITVWFEGVQRAEIGEKGRWGVLKHIPDITVDGVDDEFGEVTQLGENDFSWTSSPEPGGDI
jgi:hypothetical protein